MLAVLKPSIKHSNVLYIYLGVCQGMHMLIGQLVGALSFHHVESNSSCQTWQQAPLPTDVP